MDPVTLFSIHHDGVSRYVRSAKGPDLHIGDEVTVRVRSASDAPSSVYCYGYRLLTIREASSRNWLGLIGFSKTMSA